MLHTSPTRPIARSVLTELGRRIKAARIAAKLTQEQAAARTRIDYKRWQKLEAGLMNPTIRTLHLIALGLKTSVWKLMAPKRRSSPRKTTRGD